MKEFTFGRAGGGAAVTALTSSEGESFALREPVPVDGAAVEVWMLRAEAAMRTTLHAMTKEGVFSYAHAPRLAWVESVLGMVGLVGAQIWWTWETEDALRLVRSGARKSALREHAARLSQQLLALVAKVREPLPRTTRLKVNTLLTVDVHARDIVDGLVRASVTEASDFAWESQLRAYWERDADDACLRQCTGSFRYGFEYMGLNGRLVITPLTDRCVELCGGRGMKGHVGRVCRVWTIRGGMECSVAQCVHASGPCTLDSSKR